MSTKLERSEVIDQLKEEFSAASGLYFTAYEGVTVEKISELRNELRKVGAKYIVVKNTLARIALEKCEIEGFADYLKGPIGVAVASDDATGPAKVLKKFNKDNKDLMEMRAGYLDGTLFAGAEVAKLADLPSREELYSMFLSCLQAPVTKVAGTLNGILTNFVRTVDAVRVKKDSE
jgi:large subunit ribosomal protein L10